MYMDNVIRYNFGSKRNPEEGRHFQHAKEKEAEVLKIRSIMIYFKHMDNAIRVGELHPTHSVMEAGLRMGFSRNKIENDFVLRWRKLNSIN